LLCNFDAGTFFYQQDQGVLEKKSIISTFGNRFADWLFFPTNQKYMEAYGKVASILGLNVFASCGTIFINKYVFKVYGFNFGTTLTVFHFVVTFLLCLGCGYFGLFQMKQLEIMRVLPISLAFIGYVVFNNLSLMYNSVSFYQVLIEILNVGDENPWYSSDCIRSRSILQHTDG
jgi:hypothetical protein